MCRTCCAASLVALLVCWPRPAVSADEQRLAAALEQAVQETVKKAEPSIACVLVSRSELYCRFDVRHRTGMTEAVPGRLGRFDRPHLPHPPWRKDDERWKLQKSLDLADPDNTPESYGSGVVLDRTGLILTNAHVVRGATKVFVRLPGGAGSYADIHALDTRSDLAVLRLLDRVPDLVPLTLGNGERVAKGQFVVALANPFAAGFHDGSPTASWGIVGNLRRRIPGCTSEDERSKLCLHQFGTLIQTDARLNLGCSGGALLNLKGELVGLTTAKAALTGVETPGGFALPMNAGLRRIVEVLRRGEEVEYGFLGVRFDPGQRLGARISQVIKNSGAEQGGLHDGDYILSIGGIKVRHFDDVFVALGLNLAGSTVEIERSQTRSGPGEKVSVTLGKYYVPLPFIASQRPPARGGLRVDHASLYVQRIGGEHPDGVPDGVLIREVVSGSAAEKARLELDRIITQVNGRRVHDPTQFYEEMARARGEAELTLLKADGGSERITLSLK
ncbi:MAG TPA: trypsin-like peptidase domain-containing protein [Gemmataceae bacterium]|nr:trypsin-like peptidase domain-containing protein [Gemmataceae bacterium]